MKIESTLLSDEKYKASNDLKLLQAQNKILKNNIKKNKEELILVKSRVSRLNDELNLLNLESEALKCQHIDLQAHNEGLNNLRRVAQARMEGSLGRKQILNIDKYLEDELQGQSFNELLDTVKNDIKLFNTIQIQVKRPSPIKKSAMKAQKDDVKLYEKKKRLTEDYDYYL